MPTYVYEVINEDGAAGERFELVQKMTDPPLTHHPETGQRVRRVSCLPGSPATRHRCGPSVPWPTTRNWSDWGSPNTSTPVTATRRFSAAARICKEEVTSRTRKPGLFGKPGSAAPRFAFPTKGNTARVLERKPMASRFC